MRRKNLNYYQTATNAIIVTARCRRDNCGSGLPGAWFCGSETRHYSAARSWRLPKLKTVCLWRLRHKQNARFQLVWDDFRRGPGRAGESKLPSSATAPNPVPGSRRRNLLEATRALTGCRSFFQQAAPGAACFFRHRQHRKPVELSDSGPNVQMGGDWWQAARKGRPDDIK